MGQGQHMKKRTDRELRKMSRTELIEIIYRLQRESAQLREENARLEKTLADARTNEKRLGDMDAAVDRLTEITALLQSALGITAPDPQPETAMEAALDARLRDLFPAADENADAPSTEEQLP